MANVVCPWLFLDTLLPLHSQGHINSNLHLISNTNQIPLVAEIPNRTNPCGEDVDASISQGNGIQIRQSSLIANSSFPISTNNTSLNTTSNQIPNTTTIPNQIQTSVRNATNSSSSYADRVRGQQPIQLDVEALPSPIFIGGVPTVTLPKAAIDRGTNFCQFSLIGRVDFNKVSLKRLRTIASELWLPTGDWMIIPLGRGFFMFRLESKDDYIRIWSQAWKIGDHVLHFMKWSPDFDTEKQTTSNALIWVQFPKLGQQYWDCESLMIIGKALGTPIGVDKDTLSRTNGYFASVLIDIDLSKQIPVSVNVKEEDGKQFSQEVCIPKMPQFCSHCKSVGHNMYDCRRLMRVIHNNGDNIRRTSGQLNNVRQQIWSSTDANQVNAMQNTSSSLAPPACVATAENSNSAVVTPATLPQSQLQPSPGITPHITNASVPIHVSHGTATGTLQPPATTPHIMASDPTTMLQNNVTMTPISSVGNPPSPINIPLVELSQQCQEQSLSAESQLHLPLHPTIIEMLPSQSPAQPILNSATAPQQIPLPVVLQTESVISSATILSNHDLGTRKLRQGVGIVVVPDTTARNIQQPTEAQAHSQPLHASNSIPVRPMQIHGKDSQVHTQKINEEVTIQRREPAIEPMEDDIMFNSRTEHRECINRENNSREREGDNPNTCLADHKEVLSDTEPREARNEVSTPGEAMIINNHPISMSNSFILLGESDPVPEALAGAVAKVNTVMQRMDQFLQGNSEQMCPHTPTASKNRNVVHAICLGPRRSQRRR